MFGHFHPPHPGETPSHEPKQVTSPLGHWRSLLAEADRACCCPALPAVMVIVPPGPGRPRETDLLLCRHHFRASRQALTEIGAVIFNPDDVPEALEQPEEPKAITAGR